MDEETVSFLPYWDSLTEEEKEYVRINSTLRTFEKGELLRKCGESCMGMFVVLSGATRVLLLTEEGREVTLYRLNQGDSCVFSASCVLHQITLETQMEAISETRMLVVNAGAFAELMERNIHVKCYAYSLGMERYASIVWVLEQILFARFDQRLAGFLLDTCDRTGKAEIHMTQEAIAREVNSAREVVARMLKQFASDGLIENKRGTIAIRDRNELEQLRQEGRTP